MGWFWTPGTLWASPSPVCVPGGCETQKHLVNSEALRHGWYYSFKNLIFITVCIHHFFVLVSGVQPSGQTFV